ncbi:hypothetical protein AB0M32_52690 [Streptomyces sp. NPDC051985]
MPGSNQFRGIVEKMYGNAPVPDDADQMLKRFASRLAAELEEGPIV